MFGAVHFAGEHAQLTNRSDFSALNVSYNCWLISPLEVTAMVSTPFDVPIAQTRDCLHLVVGRAKQLHLKATRKNGFVNSPAPRGSEH